MGRPRKYTNEYMLQILKKAEENSEGILTQSKFRKLRKKHDNWPSTKAFCKRFERWSNAKKLAGIKKQSKSKKTEYKHKKRLKKFCKDCSEKEKCNINDLEECSYYQQADLYFGVS